MSSTGGRPGNEMTNDLTDHQRRLMMGALQRVIRAQAALDDAREALDRQYEARVRAATGPSGVNRFAQAEVADLAHLNAIRRDLDELGSSSRRVFRKGTDRQIQALELAGRLALDRLGLTDYRDADAAATAPAIDEPIDLAYLEYAERDLDLANHELAAIRRGEMTPEQRPRPVIAPPLDHAAEPIELWMEGIEDLEVWAGPPALPRRILPRRKQPEVAVVKFASLPRLPERDTPTTMWRMLGKASD